VIWINSHSGWMISWECGKMFLHIIPVAVNLLLATIHHQTKKPTSITKFEQDWFACYSLNSVPKQLKGLHKGRSCLLGDIVRTIF
jgi:hypothetical protein